MQDILNMLEQLEQRVQQLEQEKQEMQRKLSLLHSFKENAPNRSYSEFLYIYTNEKDQALLNEFMSYLNSRVTAKSAPLKLPPHLKKVVEDDKKRGEQMTVDRAYELFSQFFQQTEAFMLGMMQKSQFISLLRAMLDERWYADMSRKLLEGVD